MEELEALRRSGGYARLAKAMADRARGLASLALNAATKDPERSLLAAQWREVNEWAGWADRQIEQIAKRIDQRQEETDG